MNNFIYLDNSATTQPLEVVAQRMLQAMREVYANPSAAYAPAVSAEKEINACRTALLKAVDAPRHEVIFTSGGTEANNLAILGTVQAQRKPCVCYYTAIEHPAVSAAMQAAKGQGHDVRVLPVDRQGILDIDRCASLLTSDAMLISCMHVNNETGAVQPIEALHRLRMERCPHALLHVDGVQGFLHAPISLQNASVDLYALSAHKVHGPKGVGALLMRKGIRLKPQIYGGGQEGGLRSGTENTPAILGMLAAVEGLRSIADLEENIRGKKLHFWRTLCAGEPDLHINGPDPEGRESAPHILNVSFPGIRGEVLLHGLEARGIFISTGSACSAKRQKYSDVLAAMELPAERLEGAVRISFSPLNTAEEVEKAAIETLETYRLYRGLRRR